MYVYFLGSLSRVGHDSFDGHVVIARTETDARALCPHGDEGDIWWDSGKSTCWKIGEAGESEKARIVLSSYNAG